MLDQLEKEQCPIARLKEEMRKRNVGIRVFMTQPDFIAEQSKLVFNWLNEPPRFWMNQIVFHGEDHETRCSAAVAELKKFMAEVL
jgi:broad specificity phosphatase PhoE